MSCIIQFDEKSVCRFFTLLKLKGQKGKETFGKLIFCPTKKNGFKEKGPKSGQNAIYTIFCM